jgi:hypothetical protein
VLRTHPDTRPRPAELQLPELTLALRRASDKRTLAEDALRERTTQLVDAQSAAERGRYAAEGAFGMAEAARAREEDAMAREHALALRLRVAEEQGRMMDRAVGEYADLVRALERRQSLPSSPPRPPRSSQQLQPPTPPPKESLVHRASVSNGGHSEQDGRGVSTLGALQEREEGLYKLAGEFEGASEALRGEIGRLRGELEEARTELEAERKTAQDDRVRLSNTLTELELHKHDDNAAAKMVSRYMYAKFSSSHKNAPDLYCLSLPPGSSPKPQRTLYKSRSSPSPRAMKQRHPRCTRSSPRHKPRSRQSSGSPRGCGTC